VSVTGVFRQVIEGVIVDCVVAGVSRGRIGGNVLELCSCVGDGDGVGGGERVVSIIAASSRFEIPVIVGIGDFDTFNWAKISFTTSIEAFDWLLIVRTEIPKMVSS
jgi:hypothetical protein